MREEHQPSPGQSLIGRYNAQVYGSGTAIVNVYESIAPRVVDASTLDTAAQQLATLPLDRLPAAGALPLLHGFLPLLATPRLSVARENLLGWPAS